MPRKKCGVVNCDQLKTPLHPFPKEKLNPTRFKIWLEACGDPFLYSLDVAKLHQQYFICHRHFEEKYITRNERLIKIAIPTINLPSSISTGESEKNVGLDTVTKENVPFKLHSLGPAIEDGGRNVVQIASIPEDCSSNNSVKDVFNFSYLTLQPDRERNNPTQTESTSEDSSPYMTNEVVSKTGLILNTSSNEVYNYKNHEETSKSYCSDSYNKTPLLGILPSDFSIETETGDLCNQVPTVFYGRNMDLMSCSKEVTLQDSPLPEPICEGLPPELLDPEINESNYAQVTIQDTSFSDMDSLELSESNNEPWIPPPKRNIIKVFGNNKEFKKPSVIKSLLGKARLSRKGNVYILPIKGKIDSQKLSNWKIEKIVRENTSGLNRKQLLKIIRAGRRPIKTSDKKKICTCSIHCCRQNRLHETLVRSSISSRLDGNFFSNDSDEELINPSNLKTAFSISTILTNVNDKTQVEQLCQLVIESIFRLKNVNIEKSLGMLTVYFAESSGQKPSNIPQDSLPPHINSTDNVNYSENTEESTTGNQINSLNHCFNDEILEIDDENENHISKNNNSISKSVEPSAESEVNQPPSTNERNNTAPSGKKHFKVNLGAFHDHSYLALESKILFEKPEYLVNLININTYWAFKRRSSIIKPPAKVKHVPVKFQRQFSKLNKRIKHLQDILTRKNDKIKLLDEKLRHIKNNVQEKRGGKRLKYPKEVNLNQLSVARDDSSLKKNSSNLEKRNKIKSSTDFDMFPFIDENRESLDDLNPDLLLQDHIYDRFDDFFESVNLDF